MSISKENIAKIIFVIYFITIALYILIQILHLPLPSFFKFISGLISICIWIFSLAEILSSEKIKNHEKIMWFLSFPFINVFAGLLYYFMSRNRILGRPNKNSHILSAEDFS